MFSRKSDWKEGWKELTTLSHSEQAIWFLNGFWDEFENDAEKIWEYAHKFIEIQCGKPKLYGSKAWDEKEGNGLEQFKAHRFLEKIGETLSVKKLREEIDVDNDKKMCLTEYLIYRYKKGRDEVVNSPQGGDDPEVFKNAQKTFNKAKAAFQEANATQLEADEAVQALEKEEKAYKDKIRKFEEKSFSKRLSAMKRAIAKNELEQLKCKDPLPLTKAKFTSKATLSKCKRAAKAAKVQFEAAKKLFDELKKKGGSALGAIWWMERELIETQKYKPKSGFRRKTNCHFLKKTQNLSQ
jgi:hypothetical protein